MSRLQQSFQSFSLKSKANRLALFVIIGILLAGGIAYVLLTKASSPSSAYEAEDSVKTGDVVTKFDTSASGGAYISLGGDANVAKLRLFSPAWRGLGALDTTRTLAKVVGRFPELFGQDDDFNPDDVRKISADVKTYKYSLGPYVLPQQVPCNLFRTNTADPNYNPNVSACGKDPLPASAIAKDSAGYAVWPPAFPNNFLIVPDDSAWTSYVKNTLTPSQLKYKNTGIEWDGLFTDSMGSPVGDLNLAAINPNTGKAYTTPEWLTAAKATLIAKKQALGGKPLMLNGLGDGRLYYASPSLTSSPTSVFADKTLVNGVMAERIFRDPNSKITEYEGYTNWLNDINMIKDVESKGLIGYWWSKCWSKESTSVRSCRDDNNTGALTQWRRYALSSYLIAAGPHSYFNWDEDYNYKDTNDGRSAEGATEYYSEYDQAFALGIASASGTEVGTSKVWKREFSNGLVIVNPSTNTTPANVQLPPGDYKNLDGQKFSGTIPVPMHTAEILVKY